MRSGSRIALLVVVVLALVATALPALASAGGGDEFQGWHEILQYGACALAIMAATSGLGMVAAIAGCIFAEFAD